MNLSWLRKQVVVLTQDYTLVDSSGSTLDYDTDGDEKPGVLDAHINTACRNLVDFEPELSTLRNETVHLPQGAVGVPLRPELRFIERVDLVDNGSGKVLGPLQHRSYYQLRDLYGEVFSQVLPDTPKLWSHASGELLVEPSGIPFADYTGDLSDLGIDEEFLTEHNFQIYDYGTDDNGVVVLVGRTGWNVNESSAQWIPQSVTGTLEDAFIRTIFFAVLEGTETITFDYEVAGGPVLARLTNPVEDVGILSGSGTITQELTGTRSIALIPGYDGGATFDTSGIHSITVKGLSVPRPGVRADIVTMPPANRDYSLNAFGRFHYPQLSSLGDTNDLIQRHPQLVVHEACRVWAESIGNSTMVRHFQALVEPQLRNIILDKAQGRTAQLTNARGGITFREHRRRGY